MSTAILRIRLPDDMKQWLVARAKGKKCSMNAELLRILEGVRKAEAFHVGVYNDKITPEGEFTVCLPEDEFRKKVDCEPEVFDLRFLSEVGMPEFNDTIVFREPKFVELGFARIFVMKPLGAKQ